MIVILTVVPTPGALDIKAVGISFMFGSPMPREARPDIFGRGRIPSCIASSMSGIPALSARYLDFVGADNYLRVSAVGMYNHVNLASYMQIAARRMISGGTPVFLSTVLKSAAASPAFVKSSPAML